MQRRLPDKSKNKRFLKNEQENMPEFFTLLPPEIQEHIYSFLTNRELTNACTVNRFFYDSIRRHELPLRALAYTKKKLNQAHHGDFYNSWVEEIDIQNDVDLILQVANKINQEYSRGKTPAYKASETITNITHKRGFIPVSGIVLLTYVGIMILVPLMHMLKIFMARRASIDDIKRNPGIQRYMNNGYFELEEDIQNRYYYIAMTGGGLILLTILMLAINKLYKRFANDPSRLTSQIKKMSSENKSVSTSTASLFAKQKEVTNEYDSEVELTIPYM